jgi:hypothetical protein
MAARGLEEDSAGFLRTAPCNRAVRQPPPGPVGTIPGGSVDPNLLGMGADDDSGARVSTYAVALVVVGGAIWVVAALLYGGLLISCFPACGAAVLPSGSSGTAGFPAQAVRDLAWSDMYACLYIAAIGLLAIAIGLFAFRRGEKWAWYSILAFAFAGALTGLIDYLSWGGWYTSLAFGLPAVLGLLVSAGSFFQRRSTGTNPSSA